jgi:hypothetical protein
MFEADDQPAITVCATTMKDHGWKMKNKSKIRYSKIFQTVSNSSTNAVEAKECIYKNTFELSDMVISAKDGNKTILNETHWKEDISFFWAGRLSDFSKIFYRN